MNNKTEQKESKGKEVILGNKEKMSRRVCYFTIDLT